MMNLIYLIVGFGVAMGLIVIGAVVLFQRIADRARMNHNGPFIPKVPMAGIGSFAGPGAALSRLGQNNTAHRTLNTIIMRPTLSGKIFNLFLIGLMMFLMFSPGGEAYRSEPLLVLIVASATLFVLLHVALYEVSYDADGITAPNWYYQRRTHRWEDFVSVHDDGHHFYKLRFETGTITVNKYLVGMPTFLTFVSELREMTRRL